MPKSIITEPQSVILDKEHRKELIEKIAFLQRKLKDLGIPVMILLDGWDASGKSEVINKLVVPLDPRHFIVYQKARDTHELRNRPLLYRYWCDTPAEGEIALFDSSYYDEIFDRAQKNGIKPELLLSEINSFEENLAAGGTIILKYFLQLSKEEQRKRYRKIEKNPAMSWKIGKHEWEQNENYRLIYDQWVRIFSQTNTRTAPWSVIDANSVKSAVDTILIKIATSLEIACRKKEVELRTKKPNEPLIHAKSDDKIIRESVLNRPNASHRLSQDEYKALLSEYAKRIRDLEFLCYRERIPVLILFEGFDAAGKGGAIKRLCKNLDPLGYRVYPSSAPSSEEKVHNWLWRYWRAVPKRGHFSIFDRTWYGRVLVEPIEGFVDRKGYERAFSEINTFEKYLTSFGCVIIKFWMNVTSEEQLRRFREREDNPDKQWKITEEDWRNRDKRDDYILAAERMFKQTSTEYAPWIIINGDDKRWARIEVLQTVIAALESMLFRNVNQER